MGSLGFGIGEISSLGAALAWAVSTRLYREFGVVHSAVWLTIFKGIVGSAVLAALVVATGGFSLVSLVNIYLLALSGLIGITLGDSFYFMSFKTCGATLTAAIQCTAPAMAAFASYLLFGEQITAIQILGMLLIGVTTAFLILNAGNSDHVLSGLMGRSGFWAGVMLAFMAALCQASAAILAKEPLSQTATLEGAFYRLASSSIFLMMWESRLRMSYLATLPGRVVRTHHGYKLAFAALLGTVVGLGLMIQGMQRSEVGICLTLSSTYPIWLVLLDSVFEKRIPPIKQVATMVLSVVGVFLAVHSG